MADDDTKTDASDAVEQERLDALGTVLYGKDFDPSKATAAEKAKIDATAKQFGITPGAPGVVGELETAGKDILGLPLSEGAGKAVQDITGDDKKAPVKKKDDKGKKKETESESLTQFANELATQYASQPLNAIGSEGAQLAQQNEQVTAAVEPYLTGATSYNAGGSASPAVQAAMDAYGKAYATGEAINSQSYTNMGIANEQYLSAAPEQAYLQLLSQPGSGYYKEIPESLLSQLPTDLQYALTQIGDVNEGSSAAPKGGYSQAVKNEFGGATGAAAAALSTAYGSAPGTPTSPSSLATGNPAVPSS